MTEERELQERIAALSGRINLHKQQAQGHGHGRGSSNWTPHRGTPYGSYRGRAARGYSSVHRNRTLVLNNNRQDDSSDSAASVPEPANGPNGTSNWVSKRDRHMQLINASVYDQVSQQRSRAIAETMEQKRKQRNIRETAKLQKYFRHMQAADGQTTASVTSTSHPIPEIKVDGLTFRVADGGSKLVRAPSSSDEAKPTPKRAIVAGVTFFRSKRGNLYRAGLIKTKKKTAVQKIAEPCPRFTSTGTRIPFLAVTVCEERKLLTSGPPIRVHANAFLLGQCPKGPNCRFVHDPNKVAICKDYLAKGSCPLGDACDLSHQPNPHRVPACVHFLRGNCTNDDCRYAHVRVNPAAPVCRAFGRLGYCEKGADCAERHVFECPDYANKGVCRKSNCHLPHVDRAGQIRRATAAEGSDTVDTEGSSDLSSDEDEFDNSDDVDSDDLEEVFGDEADAATSRELTQQQDFIHL